MFHTICEGLYEATLKSGIEESVFIQWHGMAETSCSTVQAFVSAGVDNSSSIYLDANLPANRIVHHFNALMGGASTPAFDTECHLLATTNIFGRYINGVPPNVVLKIVHHFNALMGGASTPAFDTECHLLATTNIFGRYINGVPPNVVCYERANNTSIRGGFVHIEQKRAIRDNWDLWTKVINASFPVPSGSASHCVLAASTAFAIGTIISLLSKRY
uniref:Lipase domain-containing protein n=1 Tax=Ascaris lumbricoides TaxID=6252 RepID=A0A0M3IDD6_ASCLU